MPVALVHLGFLHNYFNIHVCPSSWRWLLRHPFILPIPAMLSQNVTNESSWCVLRVENMHSLSPSDPLRSARRGEAMLCTLHYQARRRQASSIKTHFKAFITSPVPSSCVCVTTPRMYLCQSKFHCLRFFIRATLIFLT